MLQILQGDTPAIAAAKQFLNAYEHIAITLGDLMDAQADPAIWAEVVQHERA